MAPPEGPARIRIPAALVGPFFSQPGLKPGNCLLDHLHQSFNWSVYFSTHYISARGSCTDITPVSSICGWHTLTRDISSVMTLPDRVTRDLFLQHIQGPVKTKLFAPVYGIPVYGIL